MRRFPWVWTFALAFATRAIAQDGGNLEAELDALYARRPDSGSDKAQEAAFQAALREHPNDYGVLWRVARHQQWLVDGASSDAVKKPLAKACWDIGERAVKAKPAGAEGHYYAASCLGGYAQAIGIVQALTQGLEGQFNAHVEAAVRADPRSGPISPHMLKGRAAFELPWPKRDLRKCVAELRQALAVSSGNLRAWLYLAECQLKDGDAKDAKASIDRALGGSIDDDPPEGRRVKNWARGVATKIAQELK